MRGVRLGSRLPTLLLRSDVVDLDSIAAVRAEEQEQLGVLGDRTPGVDVGLADLLSAPGTLVSQVEPLVAGDVLPAHQRPSGELGGGGGAHPGFGPVGASAPSASAAAMAARVSSSLGDGASSGYDIAA